MYHLVEVLRKVAIMITPYMEETPSKIFKQLNIENKELVTWESIKQYPEFSENLKVIEKGEPLFVRLDLEEEIEFLKQEMNK